MVNEVHESFEKMERKSKSESGLMNSSLKFIVSKSSAYSSMKFAILQPTLCTEGLTRQSPKLTFTMTFLKGMDITFGFIANDGKQYLYESHEHECHKIVNGDSCRIILTHE